MMNGGRAREKHEWCALRTGRVDGQIGGDSGALAAVGALGSTDPGAHISTSLVQSRYTTCVHTDDSVISGQRDAMCGGAVWGERLRHRRSNIYPYIYMMYIQ